jgi:type I restriction enzyme S subunit
MASFSPKYVSQQYWLGNLSEAQIQRFKNVFQIQKRVDGSEEPQVLSLTNRGVVERDISANEGQLADSYDNYQSVEIGDFVLNPMDLLSGWVAISPFKGVVSNAYFVFRLNDRCTKDGHNPRFYEHVLQNYYKLAILEPFGKGVGRPESSGGRWTINSETLGTIPIPLLAPAKQDAIVALLERELSTIDKLLEVFGSLQNLVNERLHATIAGLTCSDLSLLPSDKWSIRKIGHLFRTIGSGTTPSAGDETNFGGQTPWVTTGELRENIIYETDRKVSTKALNEFSALRVFPRGSMVMALYGATIGRIAFLGIEATVNQACCVMSDPIDVEPRFVYYALQGSKPRLMALAVGGGQPNISQEIVRQFRVAVPPLEDQREIIRELDQRMDLANQFSQTIDATISALLERRNGLIAASVTGKMDLGSA